jgi:hypothetical protein
LANYIGLLTADMRGKTGGVVFSKARSGTTLRMKNAAVRPATAAQAVVKTNFTQATQQWQGLDVPTQRAWIEQAAIMKRSNSLGQQSYLSGAQLFCKCCANLELLNTTPGLTPDISAGINPVPPSVCNSFGAQGEIHFPYIAYDNTDPNYSKQWGWVVRMTGNQSAGITNCDRKYFRVIVTEPPVVNLGVIQLWDVWIDTFAPLISGMQLFSEAFYVDSVTGLAGPVVKQSCIIL